MLTGDNGILQRTAEAKERTERAQIEEQIQMEILGSMDKDGTINIDRLKTGLENLGVTVIGDELPLVAQLNGYTYEIDENLDLSYLEDFVIDTNIPEDAVAKMNYKYYSTLQDAIDKVGTNNKKTTILLLKDISENITIAENKNIVLNLDNHKIQNANNTPIISLSGTIQVKNGSIQGTYSESNPCILVNTNAEIDFSNTNVSRNSDTAYKKETVELHGTLKINSGKIENTNQCAIWSYTDSTVNMEISGTAEINGTAENWPTIYTLEGSKTTITGGKVTATKSNTILNRGELEISGTAEINGSTANTTTIYTYAGSKTTITGGKIISNNETIRNKGNLEISGGDIEGSGEAIYNEALLEIRGGNISSSHYTLYLKSGSETKISGGNILSTEHITINNEGTLEINGTAIISRTYDDTQAGYNSTGTIWNSGTANILAGQIFADKGIALSNYGTMTIGSSAYISSGSTDKKYPTAKLHTNITLNGGKIENTAGGYAIIGFSKLTNNGGTVIGLTD